MQEADDLLQMPRKLAMPIERVVTAAAAAAKAKPDTGDAFKVLVCSSSLGSANRVHASAGSRSSTCTRDRPTGRGGDQGKRKRQALHAGSSDSPTSCREASA